MTPMGRNVVRLSMKSNHYPRTFIGVIIGLLSNGNGQQFEVLHCRF